MIETVLPAHLVFAGLDSVVSHEHSDVYVLTYRSGDEWVDGECWIHFAGHSIVTGVTVDFCRRLHDTMQVV